MKKQEYELEVPSAESTQSDSVRPSSLTPLTHTYSLVRTIAAGNVTVSAAQAVSEKDSFALRQTSSSWLFKVPWTSDSGSTDADTPLWYQCDEVTMRE